jgi:putative ABC transport system permease protein
MFLRHGLWLTTLGIAIGVAIALVVTRVLSAFLFGVSPMDPLTYAAVSVGLACMTLVATYLPAHRASRVDPVVALRGET